MSDPACLDVARSEFRRLKQLADGAVAQVSDVDFFAQPPHDGNSIALLVKHMSGNMLSRWRDFLTTDGEKPDRDRDSEFVIVPADTRAALLVRWEKGWACLFGALEPLGDGDLSRTVLIRGEPHTVLQAITRQLTHYAYHTGQIVHVAKERAGAGWRSLSVPKGQSGAFNAEPKPYLDGER